jgi:thiol-disulfide isomerase/thioredoxin
MLNKWRVWFVLAVFADSNQLSVVSNFHFYQHFKSSMSVKYIWILFLFFACDEKTPEYALIKPVPGDKHVLVEEFTGARCPNCPQGAEELENLKALYGDQLVIVSVHAGDFAFPYDESKFDFSTADGNALLQLFGNPIGYPSAVINRIKPENQNQFQQFASKWSSSIAQALQGDLLLDLEQEIVYESTNRELKIKINFLPFTDIPQMLQLSVMITEDHLIDPQADRAHPNGIVPDYEHNHVLRTILTRAEGDDLGGNHTALSGLEKSFTFKVPESSSWWKEEDLHVVSFISIRDGASREVIQVKESPVLP